MHLHNYLAGIYLNTHKKLTQNVGDLSQQTYIATCERSHVLVTLVYYDLFHAVIDYNFRNEHDISSYHDIKSHDREIFV